MIIQSKKLCNFLGVVGICFWPLIIVYNKYFIVDVTHEKIHFEQQKEMWVLGYYVLYVLDYLKGLWLYRNFNKAYMQVRFEQEAYDNEDNSYYPTVLRNNYNWKKYKV